VSDLVMKTTDPQEHVAVINDQLRKAVADRKCHACGCLHETLAALAASEVGRAELAGVLDEARTVVKPIKYDCLGCAVCYPALASNAIAEAFPELAQKSGTCATDVPVERRGWPPLPGDYHVVRYGAAVAVCTLNSSDLGVRLAKAAPEGLAIVGTLHTENLGIERLIRNVLANPNLRFLVLCGQDSRRAIGHLPGQCLESLFAEGVDQQGRIKGARGKRPVLANVTADEIHAFRKQVELVSMIGEGRDGAILEAIANVQSRSLGPFAGAPTNVGIDVICAVEPRRLVMDPAGFFVIYSAKPPRPLILEHYSVAGVLDCIIEGATPSAVWAEAISRKLLSRLDHAAYIGRELAVAERCARTGERYVQDRAPGERTEEPPDTGDPARAKGCGEKCAGMTGDDVQRPDRAMP
jgi:tetrahydromethanopterin S-methyltransferase subunit A